MTVIRGGGGSAVEVETLPDGRVTVATRGGVGSTPGDGMGLVVAPGDAARVAEEIRRAVCGEAT